MGSNKEDVHNSCDKMGAWEAFVNGDKQAFRCIFEKYYESMYGYGLKLCNRPELVKDCIQELFRSIWSRRDNLIHINSPNVYLFVSLRRKLLKKVKDRRKKRGDFEKADESDFISFSKEELIIRDEKKNRQKEKLEKALNQLSNRQKEVIYLHYYNGMSYGEIEEILSINRQSVRNHMYRAMQTLRSALDTKIMKLVISLLIFPFFST